MSYDHDPDGLPVIDAEWRAGFGDDRIETSRHQPLDAPDRGRVY
ncbi:hypothetical protein [Halosolutus halophilus]|nr:hypothetical protein [Halosolutus halophilus]